jgi:16S rRNA (uracil1498-N3)-methyltransferase
MRITRLYTQQPLSASALVTLEPRPAKHASQVLRLVAGDELNLFTGDGRDYAGRIELATRGTVVVRILSAGDLEPAPPLAITLAIGISKGERMDFALQKAVELGVTAIQPLFCKRSVVRLDAPRLEKRHQHWLGIIISACEQSGRRRLPSLEMAAGLDAWLAAAASDPPTTEARLLLDHRAPQTLAALPAPNGAVSLLIGPEGGLAPEERDAARARGFVGVRLGPRVMRTETAPLAAVAAMQVLWGDFRA